jgi:hypothetical protein
VPIWKKFSAGCAEAEHHEAAEVELDRDETLNPPSLRETALHQAGHAMVARHLGYTSTWWVWAIPGSTDAWSGRNEVVGTIKTEHQRVIGLAGEIAVLLADQREIGPTELMPALKASEFTDLDSALTDGFDADDVALCHDIVTRHLPAIRSEAREQPDVATQVRRQKSRSFYN